MLQEGIVRRNIQTLKIPLELDEVKYYPRVLQVVSEATQSGAEELTRSQRQLTAGDEHCGDRDQTNRFRYLIM